MFQNTWNQVLIKLSRLSTNKEIKGRFSLQEQLIVGSGIMYVVATILWGIMYFLIGEFAGAVIPMAYSVLLSIMLGIFVLRRNAKFFASFQHLFTLVLPFLLQITLGGFMNSSAVILWSFTSPLTALIHNKPRVAMRWFIAFIIIVIFGSILDPLVQRDNNISATFTIILFVMNILAVMGISFTLLYYLVTQKDNAFLLLSAEREKSENLLLNALPKEIMKILRNEKRLIANSMLRPVFYSLIWSGLLPYQPNYRPLNWLSYYLRSKQKSILSSIIMD